MGDFDLWLQRELENCKTQAERDVLLKLRPGQKYSDGVKDKVVEKLDKNRKVSQYALAKETGIPQIMISKWWQKALKKGKVLPRSQKMGKGRRLGPAATPNKGEKSAVVIMKLSIEHMNALEKHLMNLEIEYVKAFF